jgi:hypothetical protein
VEANVIDAGRASPQGASGVHRLVFFQLPPAWLGRWSRALIVLIAGAVIGVNAASDLVSVMVLGNGNSFSQVLGFTSTLQLICAVLSLLAVVLVVRFAWRELAVSLPRRAELLGDVRAPRIAWCAFWGSS